jgi:hypothetical protein
MRSGIGSSQFLLIRRLARNAIRCVLTPREAAPTAPPNCERNRSWRRLERVVSPLHHVSSTWRISAAPVGEPTSPSAPQLSITENQKPIWNERLLDLCRNTCCASNAPGQPPSNAQNCSVLSAVRCASRFAAHLSRPYKMNARELIPANAQNSNAGNLPSFTNHHNTGKARTAKTERRSRLDINMRETAARPAGLTSTARVFPSDVLVISQATTSPTVGRGAPWTMPLM